MRSSTRGGFTLIELLVVVVVISILVGMLVPAVNAAREAARQTKCLNNQKQIAVAIQHYVAAKDHYPGHINPNNQTWMTVILEHLGRMDLWKQFRTGGGTPVRLQQAVCPDDEPSSHPDPLSYVVNTLVCVDRSAASVCDEPGRSPSDITASAVTPLISEQKGANLQWSVPGASFTFGAPGSTVGSCLSSNHPGIVIIAFCDGHAEKVKTTTDCGEFNPGPP